MAEQPYTAYAFDVQMGTGRLSCLSVTGLATENKYADHRNGDDVDLQPQKVFLRQEGADVTFKRGVVRDRTFDDWFQQQSTAGQAQPRTVEVSLRGRGGTVVARYKLVDCVPMKWTGPTFNAVEAALAFEEIVVHARKIQRMS